MASESRRIVPLQRLYADAAGESHFETIEMRLREQDFAPPAEPFFVSGPQAAARYVLIELPVGWGGEEPHPAPSRNMLFCLAGSMVVTASDGSSRTIAAGDAMLLEDTSGKGHGSRVTSDVPLRAVMIRLE